MLVQNNAEIAGIPVSDVTVHGGGPIQGISDNRGTLKSSRYNETQLGESDN